MGTCQRRFLCGDSRLISLCGWEVGNVKVDDLNVLNFVNQALLTMLRMTGWYILFKQK
jgi:hypothetical protein